MRVAGAALALLMVLPFPAAAQSQALLDCSTLAVTPQFRSRLADAMLGGGTDDASDPLVTELAAIAETCANRNGLDADASSTYLNYSLARLPRDVLTARLQDVGIAASVIDDALGFGSGRSNPKIAGDLSQEQIETLIAALAASGVDTANVVETTWEMVGAYAATSSLMWQALRQLQ